MPTTNGQNGPPHDQVPQHEEITDATFNDERIVVDGKHFDGCTFNRCLLVYKGGLPPHLLNLEFDGCRWKFEEGAANTVNFMGALYNGMGERGRQMIEDTFDVIRQTDPGAQ